MTLFEGVLLLNLGVSLYLAYKIGGLETDIEMLYQGLAQAIGEENKT
tara:strand:- start:116 stop:256 length:141 start_codon:yes stop_codon:yes gene_type:complete